MLMTKKISPKLPEANNNMQDDKLCGQVKQGFINFNFLENK